MTTPKTHPGKEKVQAALELLQQAAKDEKSLLEQLITDKYADLSSVLDDVRGRATERVKQETDKLREAREEGEKAIKEAATNVDRYVHADPWRIIGIAAGAAFLVGFLIGRDRR